MRGVSGLLVSPVGFLIGISLGALGAGGSILAVPALIYVAGQGTRAATTTSLIVVGVAALAGMIGHLRAGRVRVGEGAMLGFAGVGGSLLGSQLNHSVDPALLLLGFSALMVAAAWRMWSQAKPQVAVVDHGASGSSAVLTEARARLVTPTATRVLVVGSAVGFLTGFFGVGGGFVIVPALVMVLGFDMATAVGTSLLVIAINSAVALVPRLATTGVDWGVAAPFALSALAGTVVGSRLTNRVSRESLLRWFVWVLVAVALYTAIRSTISIL